MNAKAIVIWVASLGVGAALSIFAFPRPVPQRAAVPETLPQVVPVAGAPKIVESSGAYVIENPSAASYVPALDRSEDMRMFDRAALFLMDSQEADGHWSTARTQGAPEFQNTNGDIALTSIAAYVLMCTSTATSQNPRAVTQASKAMRWLETKLNPDGTVGELNGPGEQSIAQLLAGAAYFQAASMSTRESLRKTAGKLMSVALLKNKARNGGYGPSPNSDEPRPDVLALAAFVYKSASLDGYQFELPQFGGAEPPPLSDDKTKNEKVLQARVKAQRAAEDAILETLRSGFKRLELPKADPAAAKTSGVFAEKIGGPADWNATVACMLANFLINPQRSAVAQALEFVFGELEAKSESYPKIRNTLRWGEKGEGYVVGTSWYGTMAVVYLFTDDKYQHKTWTGNLREIMSKQQLPDGGWAVSGEDAKRGRVWRAAFHAMTLILIAPPPPIPGPPEDAFDTRPAPGVSQNPGAPVAPDAKAPAKK